MNGSKGASLIEVLISLVLIAMTLIPLVMSQVTSLQISTRSALATQVKAEASKALEEQTETVLKVICDSDLDASLTDDSGVCSTSAGTKQPKSFHFVDYYYTCQAPSGPTVELPDPPPTNSTRTALRTVSCSGTSTSNLITTVWSVAREPLYNSTNTMILGEGVVTITVTSTHTKGLNITMTNRISCFDVYPSPQANAPAPCPTPFEN